jgi:hypothetical protein
MSTVSFQDYVRQRLRERSQGGARQEDPAAAPATRPAFAEPPAASIRARAAEAPAAVADPVTAPVTDRRATAEFRPVRPAATVRREPTLDGPDMPAGFADGWGRPDAASTDTARAALPAGRGLPDAPARTTPAPAASDALVAELQSLKGMISRQFATISWFEGVRRSPVQGKLLRTMVAAGFSLKLARSVVRRCWRAPCVARRRPSPSRPVACSRWSAPLAWARRPLPRRSPRATCSGTVRSRSR